MINRTDWHNYDNSKRLSDPTKFKRKPFKQIIKNYVNTHDLLNGEDIYDEFGPEEKFRNKHERPNKF